jgi:hypothetical protein
MTSPYHERWQLKSPISTHDVGGRKEEIKFANAWSFAGEYIFIRVKARRSLKAISNPKKELPDLNEAVTTKSSLIRTYIAHLGFSDEEYTWKVGWVGIYRGWVLVHSHHG